jgi:hypothetical protein
MSSLLLARGTENWFLRFAFFLLSLPSPTKKEKGRGEKKIKNTSISSV